MPMARASDHGIRGSVVRISDQENAQWEESAEHDTLLASDGAPTEEANPLGSNITFYSATMLNIGRILGAGIYSSPGIMLQNVGSVGMLLLFWIITPLFPLTGLTVYTEFASMFPERSGAEVVYLEQAYPSPRFFIPTIFAIIPILGSFSVPNAVVFAQYSLTALNIPITDATQTSLATLALLMTSSIVILSTRWALRVVRLFAFFQMASLLVIVLSGIAMFCGFTQVRDPYANFQHPFEGTSWNLNGLSTSFIKSCHAFIGWNNAFNVLGEIQSPKPVQTVRKSVLASVICVSILFLFANISYAAAVPREELANSGQLIAALYFQRVFGPAGSRYLPAMIALTCFGNLTASTLGQARIIREVARQGLLPYPRFFSSTKPFGTPAGPVLLRLSLNYLLLVGLPAKDAFNFVIDLASYPTMIFSAATAIGLWVIRRRRVNLGIPLAERRFRAANWAITVYLFFCISSVVFPWVPPEPGRGDVSFWYATYLVAGLALLLCCCAYYWIWVIILPRVFKYEIVEVVEVASDGSKNRALTRRYRKPVVDERQPLIR